MRTASLANATKDSTPAAPRRATHRASEQASGEWSQVRTAFGAPGFADIPIRHRSAETAADGTAHDQSPPAGGGAGGPATPLAPPATPASPLISSINIVNSAAGATSGYPGITSGDLNAPGPWNHPTNGGVSNVHQIHFNLAQGDSSTLTPRREIQRSAWFAGTESRNPADRPAAPGSGGSPTQGGFNGVLVGPDGPGAHEVKRPTRSTIVVADAPGAASLSAAQFPFIYRSHFAVTVAAGGVDIARIRYDVRIEKTNAANVPNVENSITAVDKADLVRGRSLA